MERAQMTDVSQKKKWAPSAKLSHCLAVLITIYASWHINESIGELIGAFIFNFLLVWIIPFTVTSWRKKGTPFDNGLFFILILIFGFIVVGTKILSPH